MARSRAALDEYSLSSSSAPHSPHSPSSSFPSSSLYSSSSSSFSELSPRHSNPLGGVELDPRSHGFRDNNWGGEERFDIDGVGIEEGKRAHIVEHCNVQSSTHGVDCNPRSLSHPEEIRERGNERGSEGGRERGSGKEVAFDKSADDDNRRRESVSRRTGSITVKMGEEIRNMVRDLSTKSIEVEGSGGESDTDEDLIFYGGDIAVEGDIPEGNASDRCNEGLERAFQARQREKREDGERMGCKIIKPFEFTVSGRLDGAADDNWKEDFKAVWKMQCPMK
jgi:hypothetical protein